jgi:hypothetical protein
MATTEADRYFALEDELTVALESGDVGFVDGNDAGQGEFTIFLVGPDGQALLDSVRKLLPVDLIHDGAHAVVRRQHDDEVVEERIPLTDHADREGDDANIWKPVGFGAVIGGHTRDTQAFLTPLQRIWKALAHGSPSTATAAQLVVIWHLAGDLSSDIGEGVTVNIENRRDRMLGASVPVPERPRTIAECQALIRDALAKVLELSRSLVARKRLDWDLTDIEKAINGLDLDQLEDEVRTV